MSWQPDPEAVMFSGLMWAAHNIPFFFWAWPCEWLYRRNFFLSWKVRPAKYPDAALVTRATRHLLFAKFLIEPVVWAALYSLFWRDKVAALAAPLPPLSTAVLQLLAAFYGFFVLNAFLHREMHRRPGLYKFHKWHHEFKTTTGIASEHFDPYFVDLFFNTLPTLLPPIFVGMHPLVLVVHLLLRTWESIDTHTGYAFPFTPFQYLPGFAEIQRYHVYHHSANRGTYSCLLFDHILTDEAGPYLAHRGRSFLHIISYGWLDAWPISK